MYHIIVPKPTIPQHMKEAQLTSGYTAAGKWRKARMPLFGAVVLSIGIVGALAMKPRAIAAGLKRKCPTIHAYVSESGDISIYSEATGTRQMLRVPSWNRRFKLLGYDERSRNWIYASFGSSSLVLTNGKRTQAIKIMGLPDQAALVTGRLHDSEIEVGCGQDGVFVLYSYALNGKRLGKRVFRVPGLRVGHLSDAFDTAANGYVAAPLTKYDRIEDMHGFDTDQIYIFDKGGRLVRKLEKSCGGPCFSSDGKQLGYISGDYRSKEYFTIMDLKTWDTKYVEIWPPKDVTATEQRYLEDVGFLQWDSKNQWLFVTYEFGDSDGGIVHAVDLSKSKPDWLTLPIAVNSNWILLKRMPEGFTPATKTVPL